MLGTGTPIPDAHRAGPSIAVIHKGEAFDAMHGDIKPAFGYRVTTDDLTVVISGDTAFSEKLQEMAAGADILLHEYISEEGLLRNSEAFQAYHKSSHTTTTDIGRLDAAALDPGPDPGRYPADRLQNPSDVFQIWTASDLTVAASSVPAHGGHSPRRPLAMTS